MMINRIQTDGSWVYADPNEQSLAVCGILFLSFDLGKFDTFLISLEGSPRGTELLEWRKNALDAYKSKNQAALTGWLTAINASYLQVLRDDVLRPKAVKGSKFKPGRQAGIVGPIRKAIAGLLKKNRELKNEILLSTIAAKPPKGWQFYDNRAGKYFEGPDNKNMDYARFRNIASEERAKLKQ